MKSNVPFDSKMIETEENLLIDCQFLIQELMVAKGMSRTELAEKTGISKARLSQIMGSEANPTLKTLARIFHALGEQMKVSNVFRESDKGDVAKTAQWNWLKEIDAAPRVDSEMVAVVKGSYASNDNQVYVIESDAALILEAA